LTDLFFLLFLFNIPRYLNPVDSNVIAELTTNLHTFLSEIMLETMIKMESALRGRNDILEMQATGGDCDYDSSGKRELVQRVSVREGHNPFIKTKLDFLPNFCLFHVYLL